MKYKRLMRNSAIPIEIDRLKRYTHASVFSFSNGYCTIMNSLATNMWRFFKNRTTA